MLGVECVFFIVVIALVGASFTFTGNHPGQGSASDRSYLHPPKASGDYVLTINEVGLPVNHSWNVSLGGTTGTNEFISPQKESSVSSLIQFRLANGNYSFTPASTGYADNVTMTSPNQRPDTATISGENLNYTVHFNKTYNITFNEKGLPLGKEWMLMLFDFSYNDVSSSNLSSSTRVVFGLVNGSWLVSAVPVPAGDYYAYINNSDSSSEILKINGASETINIQFYKSYYINFTESGLPAGSFWSINIANTSMKNNHLFNTIYATTPNCSVPEFNGTWYYSFGTSVEGYYAHPLNGSVRVLGKNVSSIKVKFSSSLPNGYYYLNFTEGGLPSGTSWYVTVKGTTESSTSSTITFVVQNNETYSFVVGNVNGYTSSPSSGTFIVVNTSISQTITFTLVTTPPPVWAFIGAYAIYNIILDHKGNISRTVLKAEVVNVILSNDTVALRMVLTNKTYGIPNSSIEYINWNSFSFWLGKGLISQMNNGTSSLNVSTSVKVNTPDGVFLADRLNFSYNGQSVAFYFDMYSGIMLVEHMTNSTTSFAVDITSTNIPEGNSVPSHYNITFSEIGLPSGTLWYVNLTNGQKFSSTSSTFSFQETNGTYSYSIASSNKMYSPATYSGSLTVNKGSASESISFSKVLYTVTLSEIGLPSGTLWYVNLTNGQKFSSTSSTFSFQETNGTYSYTSSNISGYSVKIISGLISVNGSGVSKTITFLPINKSAQGVGISNTELYGIVGGLVLVIAIGSAYAFIRKRK